jgi:hypothetical protein
VGSWRSSHLLKTGPEYSAPRPPRPLDPPAISTFWMSRSGRSFPNGYTTKVEFALTSVQCLKFRPLRQRRKVGPDSGHPGEKRTVFVTETEGGEMQKGGSTINPIDDRQSP